jgi:ribonuclease BN (tRNA processing enzyme)
MGAQATRARQSLGFAGGVNGVESPGTRGLQGLTRLCLRSTLILAWSVLGAPPVVDAQPSTAPIEIVVLGSGGPGATGRASSSYLALIDGDPRILIDAGSGAFVRLGEARLSLADTDIVLLTHLHVDHASELPGVFKARAVSSAGPIVFKVFGPEGSRGGGPGAYFPSTSRFLDLLFGPQGAFAYLKDFSAPISIEPHDIPATVTKPHVILKRDDLIISAVAGHHGDAPAVIYRVEHAGKSVTFSGDIDRQGLAALSRIAEGSDLLVFNSVVLDPPGSPAVLYTLHTPPLAIGELARAAGVHGVLLSHLSPAIEENHAAVLQSIRRNYQGPVSFAEDGMRLRP